MGIHAVIIDDSPSSGKVLAGYLKLESATSTVVTDPTKIDDSLKDQNRVDVIFLDLEMPGLDGYAVFDLLRAKPEFTDTPIIAYSVHVNELKNTHELGFNGFIGKPLSDKKFSAQLSRILKGEGVWDANNV